MESRILLLIYLLLCTVVQAQQPIYNFRHIGISDGLPDNYVKSVFGLPDGRLGVRTSVLLNLYDGRNFVSFPLTNSVYPIEHRALIPVQYVDNENRLWLKENGFLRVFDLNRERFVSVDSVFATWHLQDEITNIFVDDYRHIWVTDTKHRLYKYDSGLRGMLLMYDTDEFVCRNGMVLALEVYGDTCWLVYESGLIRCFDRKQKKFIRQETFLQDRLEGDSQVVIRMLENGDFWLMWNTGIGYYNGEGKLWTEIDGIPLKDCGVLNGMDTDRTGNLWLGTTNRGAYVIDRYTLSPVNAGNMFTREVGKEYDYVHSVYFDRQNGTLWVGFFNRGLACHHPSMNNFTLYNRSNTSGEWRDEGVHSMLELEDGSILIGGQKGLYRYNPETHVMDVPYRDMLPRLVRKLYRDSRHRIWVGTYRDGLYCIENGKISSYLTTDQDSIGTSNVRTLLEDGRGELWVSVNGGVGRFNPQDGTLSFLFEKFPLLKKYKLAHALALDANGCLVVGADNGLYVYDMRQDTVWIPEVDAPGSPLLALGSNKYNCVLRDSRGLMWLGTQYGIKVMHEDKHIDFLGQEHGFTNATVQSIREDNNHDIWVSTINAIYKIVVEQKDGRNLYRMTCLDRSKAQEWNTLYDFSSLKTRDGQIYFGKMNGFCVFTPENVVFTPCINKPLFTSFRLFDKPVSCGERYNGRVLFGETIDRCGAVLLDYDEDFVTLSFSSLSFVNPSQTYFRYILEGLDKQWTETMSDNGSGSVTYNSIPPGKYVFRVQAAGNDYKWGPEAAFAITVRPPFWNTVWARLFYLLCFIGTLYGAVVYQKRRGNRRLLQMKELEAVKQKEELNQMKFRFFTNVSHELRTPLTLIITPLEILRKKIADEKILHQLDIIYKNAQELYGLVNQLLDFRKVEMQMEKLHLTPSDMEEFVTSIHGLFMPFAVEKQLDFRLRVRNRHLFMYFDHDKLHKIINNLLSNAFKFTPENGTVTLDLSRIEEQGRNYVRIAVIDTGIGIPEEQRSHIFERFYQVQNWDENKIGTGIGLHLVKEYVQIHEGRIEVTGNTGEGTTFAVYLPMDLKPVEEETARVEMLAEQELEEVNGISADTDGKKKILIVEDNDDVRAFLKEQLEEWYSVLDAPDGEAGEQLAIEHNPNLIVSDIMMPKVDGIELCRRIKTNVQTSHIPVVLLTARTADDIKISSYEVGADSYIAKPFNFDVLLVRIRKLIEQQESRKQEFRKNIRVNPSVLTITSLDEQLIQKALEQIERNIDNPEYSVESLSRDLGMSRMNLYRKLQSVTGHTPTEFIKTIRLKRAAQLLQGSQLTMVEVADRVGFSSSSYFTKCFKEQFGVLPTQYAENEEYWAEGK
ncbi:ATP-binding protein [uncultured Bacteroides sp.]|uniref:hybrid sensor histidine kinase/response regulator n=1 Tax=uncultured Bacteroides sp. TaxID=162156 RepID=UPI00280B274B|nr:ATP-binding protein [uncultured Bacteroides sp.]